jgi:hypothetical protein
MSEGYTNEAQLRIAVLMSVEAGIPLMDQLDTFCRQLPGLLLELLHYHSLNICPTGI